MGDIADEMLDRWYGFDDKDKYYYVKDRPNLKCRRCGKKNLFWEETEQGWRLRDGDNFHTCDVTNMFDIIEEN
jgi:hypothetical protein